MGRDLEEFVAWDQSRNSFWENFKKNINPMSMIGFIGMILFGWYIMSNSTINPTWIYLITGVVLALIIFRTERVKPKDPIPDNIIKMIALTLMRRKIGTSEFEVGTSINLNGYCRLQYEGEWGQAFRAWKWAVGFEIRFPDGLRETRLVLLHPFDGYITGIQKKPAGWTGEDAHDVKILTPTMFEVQTQKPKT